MRRRGSYSDGSVREVAHVSKERLAAADAEQDSVEGHPGCLSSAEKVPKSIVGRNGPEHVWHVPATNALDLFLTPFFVR